MLGGCWYVKGVISTYKKHKKASILLQAFLKHLVSHALQPSRALNVSAYGGLPPIPHRGIDYHYTIKILYVTNRAVSHRHYGLSLSMVYVKHRLFTSV